MIPQRIALIGASGQLGSALRAVLSDRKLIEPRHADLPFEETSALERLLDEYAPELLINCSAFHHVDACEREVEQAFRLNTLAVDRAAAACAVRNIAFATLSTDYVFSGTSTRPYRESDAVAPRTVYGISKAAGELLVRRHGQRHFIIRTSGIFSNTGTSNKGVTLIEKVLRQAEDGQPARMVDDIIFSPSYAPHVARALRDIFDAQAFGTHHVVNAGECSWYDFVATAFAKAGFSDALLERGTYGANGNPTPRPLYSPLANTTFARIGVPPLPPWERALAEFLTARPGRVS